MGKSKIHPVPNRQRRKYEKHQPSFCLTTLSGFGFLRWRNWRRRGFVGPPGISSTLPDASSSGEKMKATFTATWNLNYKGTSETTSFFMEGNPHRKNRRSLPRRIHIYWLVFPKRVHRPFGFCDHPHWRHNLMCRLERTLLRYHPSGGHQGAARNLGRRESRTIHIRKRRFL